MDPTIILKLVREQRRQINDTFSPQQRVSPIYSSPSPNLHLSNTSFTGPVRASKSDRTSYPNQSDQNFIKNGANDSNNYSLKIFHPSRADNNQTGFYSNDVKNFPIQSFQNLNEAFIERKSLKCDKFACSNLSDPNDFNRNNSNSNDLRNFPNSHPNSPFQLIQKRKNMDEVYQDRNSSRMYKSHNFSNLNSKAKNIAIQQNYLNEDICTKECCVPAKNLNYREEMIKNASSKSKSYFCECKECIELANLNSCSNKRLNTANSQQNFPSFCDCPSCNLSLIKKQRNQMPMFSQKSLAHPIPPVPTNRFVISKNSSFSPITPSNKNYTENNQNKNNYSLKESFDKKGYYHITPHSVNKCFCSDCKIDEGQTSVDSSVHIDQMGLTKPLLLANNCGDFQNIIRQKNAFFREQISKRKLEDTLDKKISTNANMSKKNRILNYERAICEQNNSDGVSILRKDEIELGEVLNVDKARSPIETVNYDKNPVTISKKMMPMIAKRMNEWLEKTVECVYNFSTKTGLKHEKLCSILSASWSKILLIYMIENKLEFYFTKDNNFEKNSDFLDFPNEKDASELLDAIQKCHYELDLENNGYDLLREMVILRENSNEPKLMELEKASNIKNKIGNEKLTCLLSNIQNIRIGLIKSLFYPNVSVQDLLNKKMMDLTNKQLIFNHELSKPESGF